MKKNSCFNLFVLMATVILVITGCSDPAGGGGQEAQVAAIGVTFNKERLTMFLDGGTETLTATITPADATDKRVTWTSYNPEIASVSNGVITAHTVGNTFITATPIKLVEGGFIAHCGVTVMATGTTGLLYDGAIDDAHKISSFQRLTDALTYISTNAINGKNYFIVLGADEEITAHTLAYSSQTVSITLIGEGSRTISLSGNGSLFTVESGVTLVLDKDITLRGHNSNSSPLVRVNAGGTFIMQDNSKASGNTGSFSGGGVYVAGSGTFTMQNTSQVSGNTANGGGGVYIANSGTFTMQDASQISDNTASSLYGGGVYVGPSGTFTMQNTSQVSGNTVSSSSSFGGGGVSVDGGIFTMQDASQVSGNTAARYGGGVEVHGGTFTMQNTSQVSGNTASSDLGGGGVSVFDGTFTMQDASQVSDNTASSSQGGGVSIYDSTFTMQNTSQVNGNTASNGGGGVCVSIGTFTMQDTSQVSGNTANSGGGAFVLSGTITMQDTSQVSGNTASYGGGVYVWGTFAMQDTSQVSGNTASQGGGVYAIYCRYIHQKRRNHLRRYRYHPYCG